MEELAIARADGRYPRLLTRIAKVKLLILDDWAITPMTAEQRRDLLEIVEDRSGRASTAIASQIPIADWHNAILDRLAHNACRIEEGKPHAQEQRQNQAADLIEQNR